MPRDGVMCSGGGDDEESKMLDKEIALSRHRYRKSPMGVSSNCALPPALYACRESLRVLSAHYPLSFSTPGSKAQLRYNFENDVLYLDGNTYPLFPKVLSRHQLNDRHAREQFSRRRGSEESTLLNSLRPEDRVRISNLALFIGRP